MNMHSEKRDHLRFLCLGLLALTLVLSQSAWLIECEPLQELARGSVLNLSPEELEKQAQLLSEDGQDVPAEKSLQTPLGRMLEGVVQPAKDYYSIIKRYHAWFRQYAKLQASIQRPLPPAMEVLRREYAKADELLAAEACAKPVDSDDGADSMDIDGAATPDPNKVETLDFVYKALSKVIVRLEEIADDLEMEAINASHGDVDMDTDSEALSVSQEEYGQEDARVAQAMDRVKRTAVRTAKRLVKSELIALGQVAALNAFASYLATRETPPEGDMLSLIAPVVGLLGSASTPLIVSYFQNVQFRAALAIIDRINPMKFFCKKE